MARELKNRSRFLNELIKINGEIKKRKAIVRNQRKEIITPTDANNRYNSGVMEVLSRMRLQKELQISQELFSKAFNCSPLIMAIRNYSDGKFVEVNDTLIKVTGYMRDELIGRTPEEIMLWSVSENDQTNESVQDKSFEVKFSTKGGETRIGIISSERVEFGGENCILETIADVTEVKKLRDELSRLGELNLVGKMAASIGHEIRNPMTTARGFLQMLCSKRECEQFREYFDIIIDELDRANNIVSEFLSMTPKNKSKLKKTTLNSVINVLFPLLKADALIRDNQIKLDLQNIPELMMDERAVRQLVLNLARNGFEAMEPGGVLSISTYLDGDEVVLAVKDQGKGIDPKLMEKLGTPFLTTKENGTGLGLAVCYKIAEKHNAVIKVESDLSGTTFYIRFKMEAN